MNSTITTKDFYVVAREAGAENPSLPTWANQSSNPALLADKAPLAVSRKDIPEVPGTFQLLNVFTAEECEALINITETLGYLPDAAVSLPREVRHNHNLTWVVDEATDRLIWERCASLFTDPENLFDGLEAVGLNARFRFYRYEEGDYFKFHTDGAWPGSRVIDQQLVANAYPDRYSEMTFLILLSEDFDGGATRFRVNADNPYQPVGRHSPMKDVDIRTPAGSVLCFPHGMHPLHRVHSSVPISRGTKYIIRSDVLFKNK
jgi:predicted 2-oxoglutarate/Fe(II)-dependent dioxygenase YbiX